MKQERSVYKHIAKYAHANNARAIWDLCTTLLFYGALLYYKNWFLLPLAVLLRTRLFVIFHDMCHNSYFSSSQANTLVGQLISMPLWSTFTGWRAGHLKHHKSCNNHSEALWGQTCALTKQQFKKEDTWFQYVYVLSYGHYTLFTVIPYLYFLLYSRFFAKWYENLSLFVCYGIVYGYLLQCSLSHFLYDQACGFLFGIVAFLLFHIQHSFDGSVREYNDKWSFFDVGMKGSSFLQVPKLLKYFTYGIEYHHIHHLNSKVPGYHVGKCHDAAKELHCFDQVPQVTMKHLYTNLKYTVYDEESKMFGSLYKAFF